MLVAAEIAVARGALADAARQELADVIAQMGPLPPVIDLSPKLVLEAIRRDKKVVQGRLHYVLPIAIGAVTTVDDVSEAELEQALRKTGMKG
jgi:3-dehydroquinate synthase